MELRIKNINIKRLCLKFIRLQLLLLLPAVVLPQGERREVQPKSEPGLTARERELASRFAPVFRQGLGEDRRGDYLTNFDFDGDWRGDNNWRNAADPRYKLRAYVYYAVSETETHYFIHYAVFHPRDYKGGALRGTLLSEAIKEGVRLGGKYDPTGLSSDAVLAHENDMEGCLVVVAKNDAGSSHAHVAFVETLSHDRFLKYVGEGSVLPGFEKVTSGGGAPELYIEPKGHGISAYVGGTGQTPQAGLLTYRYTGTAGDPEAENDGSVGYELLPLESTIWPRALRGVNETFGQTREYGALTISVRQGAGRAVIKRVSPRKLGSAFLGKVGAPNMARPPWGWYDRDERDRPLGGWFFDPASVVKRDFKQGSDFSVTYLKAPFYLGTKR